MSRAPSVELEKIQSVTSVAGSSTKQLSTARVSEPNFATLMKQLHSVGYEIASAVELAGALQSDGDEAAGEGGSNVHLASDGHNEKVAARQDSSFTDSLVPEEDVPGTISTAVIAVGTGKRELGVLATQMPLRKHPAIAHVGIETKDRRPCEGDEPEELANPTVPISSDGSSSSPSLIDLSRELAIQKELPASEKPMGGEAAVTIRKDILREGAAAVSGSDGTLSTGPRYESADFTRLRLNAIEGSPADFIPYENPHPSLGEEALRNAPENLKGCDNSIRRLDDVPGAKVSTADTPVTRSAGPSGSAHSGTSSGKAPREDFINVGAVPEDSGTRKEMPVLPGSEPHRKEAKCESIANDLRPVSHDRLSVELSHPHQSLSGEAQQAQSAARVTFAEHTTTGSGLSEEILPHSRRESVRTPGDVFSTIDGQADSTLTPRWIHTSPRRAEAGFIDPALGWVSVRAHADQAGIHATVVPDSPEAARLLSLHLSGLDAHLADRHLHASPVTLAGTERGWAEHGFNDGLPQRHRNEDQDRSSGDSAGVRRNTGNSVVAPQRFRGGGELQAYASFAPIDGGGVYVSLLA